VVDAVPGPTAAELAEIPEGVDPIQVEFVWTGVGALYKGFFTEREALTALARRLAPHLVPPAQLHISWDPENMLGRIRLVVPPSGFRNSPKVVQGVLPIQELAPIMVALAAYRDAVSAQFDIRIASFVVGIDRTQGPAQCRLGIKGAPPPDGSELDPCLHLNGKRVCGALETQGVRFTGDDLKIIQRCFAEGQ
jgi:hypothetical protein